MLIRRNILPRSLGDCAVSLFTLLIIPTVYYFELFVVMPRYHPQWSCWYWFHFLTGSFILFNIASNYMAIILCDTSIRGRILPMDLTPQSRFCVICECIAPERSWHCNICDICILKRDHHCMFTGCCIGHHNQRYFIMFIAYLFIATLYASYYNIYFVGDFVEFNTIESVVKVIFPLAALVVDYSIDQLYLFLVLIVVIGCFFTGTLLYFHLNLIFNGMVTYEKNHKNRMYDLGKLENFRQSIGDRWYLVWVSPFIHSQLNHDGVNWKTKQSSKVK